MSFQKTPESESNAKANHFQEKLDEIKGKVDLGRYVLDEKDGTYYLSKTQSKEDGVSSSRTEKVQVSPIPVVPVCLYQNIDSSIEKVEIAYFKRGKWRTLITERSVASSQSAVLKLADKGIEVSTNTAKTFVKYISDVIGKSINTIDYKRSKSVMGWEGDEFMPFTDNIVFDADDTYKYLFDAFTTKGDLDEWIAMTNELREVQAMRLAMGASFASPLISLVGENPFVFHLWGGTGTGKTVSQMVAMSIWGNPEQGKLTRTMNMTANSMLGTAAFLRHLPFAGDELQTIKARWNNNYDDLIMCVTEGIERGRMSFDKMNEVRSWKCSFLFTGEENCVKQSSGGGAKNRVIAYECNDKIVDNGNKVAEFVRKNYGIAGRKFLQRVKETDVNEMYRTRFNAILDEADTTDKQAGAMALIMTADEIARELFYPSESPLEVRDIKDYLCSAKEVDVTERAFEYICTMAARYPDRFDKGNGEINPVKGEYWGRRRGNTLFINKNVLDTLLMQNGFDFDACKKKWAENGHLNMYYGRYVARQSFRTVNAYYVGLNIPETEPAEPTENKPKFVELPNDDLPFTMDGEQTKL